MKNNWQTKKLGEICKLQGGFAFKSFDYKNDGIPLVRIQNLQDNLIDKNKAVCISEDRIGEFKNFLLRQDDILIAMSGATTGKMALVKKSDLPLLLNQRVGRFVIKNEFLDNNYLWYFLNSIKDIFLEQAYGGAQPNISPSKIENLEIPLLSLPEQKKIVKLLDEKMGKIAEVKRVRAGALAETEKILSQTLHEIFTQKQHTDILKFVGMSKEDSRAWEEKTIGEIAVQIKSGFACGKQNEVSDGIVHLRTHNISLSGELNLDKIIRIPKKFVDTNIFNLKKDDLIFNNTNSMELVGKTILIREDLAYAFSNHLTRIRFDKEKVMPAWVLYVFQKYWADKVFERMCTRWIGQAGINQTSLSKIKILLPPLTIQQKIVSHLDKLSAKVRHAIELQKAQLDDFKKLEKAYLREAFGEKI